MHLTACHSFCHFCLFVTGGPQPPVTSHFTGCHPRCPPSHPSHAHHKIKKVAARSRTRVSTLQARPLSRWAMLTTGIYFKKGVQLHPLRPLRSGGVGSNPADPRPSPHPDSSPPSPRPVPAQSPPVPASPRPVTRPEFEPRGPHRPEFEPRQSPPVTASA